MTLADELRQQSPATWAAGDWDRVAGLVTPVGARVKHFAVGDFGGLVGQFNAASDGGASISSEYLLLTVER